jgi:hypothetical protein
MTTKQVDAILGREVKVRYPNYPQQPADTMIIVSRRKRSRTVECRLKAYGGRLGVFDCRDLELVETL